MRSPPVQLGRVRDGSGRYVIFASLDEGELVTPAFCPQTQPVSGWKDMAPLRAYARAHRAPPTKGGRAAAAAARRRPPPPPKAGS